MCFFLQNLKKSSGCDRQFLEFNSGNLKQIYFKTSLYDFDSWLCEERAPIYVERDTKIWGKTKMNSIIKNGHKLGYSKLWSVLKVLCNLKT